MHKLLTRQLKRAFGAEVPAGLDRLLQAVDDAYQSADADRASVERSLDLMSTELFQRNDQLRRDLEVQQRTEEALRQREAEFLDLIQNVPQVILVRQGDHFVFVNRSGLDVLGYRTADEIRPIPVLSLFHPDEREQAVRCMAHVEATGRYDGPVEMRFLRADGDVVTVEIALARTIAFLGQEAVLIAGQDVTERKKLQQRLLLADRMASVGTLAAGVAHEINNPLAYVLANLGFAAELMPSLIAGAAGRDADEFREALAEAVQGAKRVQEIVKGMKIFSRADQEKTTAIDLAAVVDSALGIAHNEIRHRARVVKEYGEVPLVLGNEGRLGQVFVNLLVNAAQAIPDGAASANEIRIAITAEGTRVKVTIRDTGSGMPPEVQRRIFDPFFTTKPIGVGSGLGLAICHGIIVGHGGEIGVESAPGQGTTFTVSLPGGAGVDVPSPLAAEAPSTQAPRRRVLVIDDEALVGKSVRRTLRDHDVEVVTTGRQAIERFDRGQRYEVIVCDLMMPEMTGMDLHRAVTARWPDLATRIVFLTGGAFSTAASDFLQQVTNRMIEKPFEPGALRALVNELSLAIG